MLHAPVAPNAFPPETQTLVLAHACSLPGEHDQPATRWSLDDLAAHLVNQHAAEALSRSTLWRILNDVDLKPHRSIYWLSRHDPDFDTIAQEVCRLYVQAPVLYRRGHVLICTDEKSGMQILQRKYPTKAARPGHPERRERDYLRHGTRTLIASFVVPTGEVVWDLGPRRTNSDFAAYLRHVVAHLRGCEQMTWVVDNLNIHWSLDVGAILAALNDRPFLPRALRTGRQRRAFISDPDQRYRLVFLPRHGSWLNQVELWFSVLARQFLKRGDFASADEFARRLQNYVGQYNAEQAHPYRWTYTGQPLVRATPFSQTRRQQQQGRAWCSSRPYLWERVFYPPRQYRRHAA